MFCIASIAAAHIIKRDSPLARSNHKIPAPLCSSVRYNCCPLSVCFFSPIVEKQPLIHLAHCWGTGVMRSHAAIRTEPHRTSKACFARTVNVLVHSDPTTAQLCIFLYIYKGKYTALRLPLIDRYRLYKKNAPPTPNTPTGTAQAKH